MVVSRRIAVTALAVALAVPAAAGAARPIKGVFYNGSSANGGYLETTHHTITTLELYCKETRYHVWDLVSVRRDGTFSHRGRADRYGAGGRPMGTFNVRLSGRFTRPNRVKIKRTLSGCNTRTVVIAGKSR
jgi:hypothetical protein